MLHVVLMLFQEINKQSYGRLCCSPLTMAHTLFHDVGAETLYTGYSIGYTVRPMHILFRPCGLTLNKRNDRQRTPKLCQEGSKLNIKDSIRITKVWNELPDSVVNAPNVNTFKNRLGRHWKGDDFLYN